MWSSRRLDAWTPGRLDAWTPGRLDDHINYATNAT